MSATGRGATRRKDDFYETPAWCVHRLLDRLWLPASGLWLEPAAGRGAIIRAVDDWLKKQGDERAPQWTGVDIDAKRIHKAPGDPCHGDFLRLDAKKFGGFDVVITNPPYLRAFEFIEKALPMAPWVAMLLRLNFLGSKKRAQFFRASPPDVYVLARRPSFTGGRTDATEYAWFVWPPRRRRNHGRLEVLD